MIRHYLANITVMDATAFVLAFVSLYALFSMVGMEWRPCDFDCRWYGLFVQ